jgi:hypothetical protein
MGVRGFMQQSYAFLMNVRSLLDAQTFQLAEGHELRCANSDEIEGIKRTIDQVNVFSRYGYSEARLEEDGLVSAPTENGVTMSWHSAAMTPY